MEGDYRGEVARGWTCVRVVQSESYNQSGHGYDASVDESNRTGSVSDVNRDEVERRGDRAPFAALEGFFFEDQPSCLLWVRIPGELRLECGTNPRTEAGRCHKCAGGLHDLPKAVADIEA